MNNPFKYSDTNLRYYSFNYYLKNTYEERVVKVPIDAGFDCPNRDGKCASGGCTFCSSEGSGELIEDKKDTIMQQYQKSKSIMYRKWPNSKTIAYFQAYTNTYAPLARLKEIYSPFLDIDEVVGIAIGTRPDCLPQDVVDYLDYLTNFKDIYLELGLQTMHNKTAKDFNRAYDLDVFEEALKKLAKTKIKVCVHIINGLPDETPEMMLETAKYLATKNIHSIKIHMLHLVKDSYLGRKYLYKPWKLLTKQEYVEIVVNQLEVIPPNTVVQRLTGDGMLNKLIEPKWTIKKVSVLNDIQKEFVHRNSYQGIHYK